MKNMKYINQTKVSLTSFLIVLILFANIYNANKIKLTIQNSNFSNTISNTESLSGIKLRNTKNMIKKTHFKSMKKQFLDDIQEILNGGEIAISKAPEKPTFRNLGFKCVKSSPPNKFKPVWCALGSMKCKSRGIVFFGPFAGGDYKWLITKQNEQIPCDYKTFGVTDKKLADELTLTSKSCWTHSSDAEQKYSYRSMIPSTADNHRVCIIGDNPGLESFDSFSQLDNMVLIHQGKKASCNAKYFNKKIVGFCRCYDVTFPDGYMFEVNEIYYPMRISTSGDLECHSIPGGKHCNSLTSKMACDALVDMSALANIKKADEGLAVNVVDYFFNRWICPENSGLNVAVRYISKNNGKNYTISCLSRNGTDCFYGADAQSACERITNCPKKAIKDFKELVCGSDAYIKMYNNDGFKTKTPTWCKSANAWLRFDGKLYKTSPTGETVLCANENENCPCYGTVSYGANGKFNEKESNGSLKCNNKEFGDPIPGTVKKCLCKSNTKICAKENETCNCYGTVNYGANGKFIQKEVNGTIICNNANFGEDPIFGTAKKCLCTNSSKTDKIAVVTLPSGMSGCLRNPFISSAECMVENESNDLEKAMKLFVASENHLKFKTLLECQKEALYEVSTIDKSHWCARALLLPKEKGEFVLKNGTNEHKALDIMLGKVYSSDQSRLEKFAVSENVLERFEFPERTLMINDWNSKESHVIRTADVNGDGYNDIIAFAEDGVFVSLNDEGKGEFKESEKWIFNFGRNFNNKKHLRFVIDVNNDKKADLVVFSDNGVFVSTSTGHGFEEPELWSKSFGVNEKWDVKLHMRWIIDVNQDGLPDIFGCGNDGCYAALNDGFAFAEAKKWSQDNDLGFTAGWRADRHVMEIVDVNNDGFPDFVGLFDDGIYVAYNKDMKLEKKTRWTEKLGTKLNFNINLNRIFFMDLNKDGWLDIIAFTNKGVEIMENDFVSFKYKGVIIKDEKKDVFCANENKNCKCNGTVIYGAKGKFNEKETTNGSIVCSNKEFGDPIPGTAKKCSCKTNTTICAKENQNCKCNGTVSYGANGKFNEKEVNGSIICSNKDFGDPISGVVKKCLCTTDSISINTKHFIDMKDVNKDGFPDIVAIGEKEDSVYINGANFKFEKKNYKLGEFASKNDFNTKFHFRQLVDLNNDKFPDFIGINSQGVSIALNNYGSDYHKKINVSTLLFCKAPIQESYDPGKHMTKFVDMNNDGLTDIVVAGNLGIYVALNIGDYKFSNLQKWTDDFRKKDRWLKDFPIEITDLNGDKYPDIVGFGETHTYVAYNEGGIKLGAKKPIVDNLSYKYGWKIDRHQRYVTDFNNDGYPDLIGYGQGGINYYVNNKDGTFGEKPSTSSKNTLTSKYGFNQYQDDKFLIDLTSTGFPDVVVVGKKDIRIGVNKEGKITNHYVLSKNFGSKQLNKDNDVREFIDMNKDGKVDIVGISSDGVSVGITDDLSNYGNKINKNLKLKYFGTSQAAGSWNAKSHRRFVKDINNDGYPDIIGFYNNGVQVSLNMEGNRFDEIKKWSDEFGNDTLAGNWNPDDLRELIDLNNDGYPDIVGIKKTVDVKGLTNNIIYVSKNLMSISS